MPVLEYPVVQAFSDPLHINSMDLGAQQIRADIVSVTQFCAQQVPPITLVSYTRDPEVGNRFSNDGGRLYNYYDAVGGRWMNQYGYEAVVVDITYS